jgi:2-keto-4-pentenoate hydratase
MDNVRKKIGIAATCGDRVAGEAFAVLHTGDQISPFSARFSGFNLEDAYRVTAAIRQMREERGEIQMGRKIESATVSRSCSQSSLDGSFSRLTRSRLSVCTAPC